MLLKKHWHGRMGVFIIVTLFVNARLIEIERKQA
jgi:hypothetical protein